MEFGALVLSTPQQHNILNGDFASVCLYFPARQSWVESIQKNGIDPTQHVRRAHQGIILFRYLTDAQEMGLVWDHSLHDTDQIAIFAVDTGVLDKSKCFTTLDVKLPTGSWYTFYSAEIKTGLHLVPMKIAEESI